jgi:ornithine cyclodeaminase/alanine dehydrogenase-like protein (mu-crystallin family)
MSSAGARHLSESDVLNLLPPIGEQINLVARALRDVASGAAHQPPKVPLDLGAGAAFAHAMPAAIDRPLGRVAGAKWISGGSGAPIGGAVLVERAGAGGLRGIVAAAALTAARTAAVSGAALQAIGRSGVSSLAIVGGGAQARSHRALFAALFPDVPVVFYSRRSAAELPMLAGDRVASSAAEALHDAQVAVTAAAFGTTARAIDVADVALGATLLVIDYATTINGALVGLLAARGPIAVITDSAAQFEATRAAGKLDDWPAATAQIGDAGLAVPNGTTILVNHLGVAACDIALADALLDAAEAHGAGTLIGA